MPPSTPCKLTPIVDPVCSFKASATGSVTLEVKGTSGSVMFDQASYNGTSLISTPAASITFDIVAGSKNLDLVYAFSDPQNGKGTLNEACANHAKLKDVAANNTAVSYVICA